MKLKVNKDTCTIIENEVWNVGDYNVHTVEVELSNDFNGLVNKVRYFVGEYCYDMLITNNVAQVPIEATQNECVIEIGVYGFDTNTDMLVQSTTPVQKYISKGTYTGEPENVEPLTPTDKEQMETAIQANTNAILTKQDILVSGENIKTINNQSILGEGNIDIQGGGGTGNYPDLNNLPSVNNVTLIGNKTSSQLGLQPAGSYATTQDLNTEISNRQNTDSNLQKQIDDKADKSEIPEKTSDLTNDSGFITNTVSNLLNYYTKTQTFTKQEVNDLISAISTLTLEVVQTLPTEDISTTTIYLVPKATAEINDVYDEYIYVSNAWEHIGSTQADLSNYYTKTQVDGKVNFTIDGTTYTTVQDTIDMLITEFNNALNDKADVNDVVDLTSTQTITGTKSFNTMKVTTLASINNSRSAIYLSANDALFYGSIYPSTADASSDLGISSRKWRNLYLRGNLTDGTNNIAVNKIANKDNFVTLTQAEYDALGTKDPNTYYFIEEE